MMTKLKDYVSPDIHQKLKNDLDILDEKTTSLEKEKLHLVKMFDILSKERNTAQEDYAKTKSEKQMQFVELQKASQ